MNGSDWEELTIFIFKNGNVPGTYLFFAQERQSLAGTDKRKRRSSAFLEDDEKPVEQVF